MVRSFRVMVNGKTYDITVEEMANGQFPAGTRDSVPAGSVQPSHPISSAVSSVPSVSSTSHIAPESTVPASTSAHSADKPDISGDGNVKAPIPGVVNSIRVTENQAVKKGDVILILEAMKMENEICAHTDGTVTRIFVQAGTMVNAGDLLLDIS